MRDIPITNGSHETPTITKGEVHRIILKDRATETVSIQVIDGTISVSNHGNIQAEKTENFKISSESPLEVTGVGNQTNKYSLSCLSYEVLPPH